MSSSVDLPIPFGPTRPVRSSAKLKVSDEKRVEPSG
jgi:hypothetical protein